MKKNIDEKIKVDKKLKQVKWNVLFNAAKEYFLLNGDLDVPTIYTTDNGLHLGRWIKTMRLAFIGKGSFQLSDNQVADLESIGMDWKVKKIFTWDSYYSLAKEYYKEHGNLLIPPSYVTSNDVKLGRWIFKNKQAYRGVPKSGLLTDDQIKKLELIGMQWCPVGKQIDRINLHKL
jgi:hypothetical protein